MSQALSSRPRTLTLLALCLLAASLFQALGVWAILTRWAVVSGLQLSLPPGYVILRNGVTGFVFMVVALGLWDRRRWAAILAAVGLPLIAAWTPLERAWFGRSDFALVSLPWSVAYSVVWVGLALFVIFRARRGLR